MFNEKIFAIDFQEKNETFFRKADISYNAETLLARFNIDIEQTILSE